LITASRPRAGRTADSLIANAPFESVSILKSYFLMLLPLAKFVNDTFLECRRHSPFKTANDWVFASPQKAGKYPLWSNRLQQRFLTPLGQHERLQLPMTLGWHTFRHS